MYKKKCYVSDSCKYLLNIVNIFDVYFFYKRIGNKKINVIEKWNVLNDYKLLLFISKDL